MPRILYILFFLSGVAGLVYQVVWSRLLNEVFGVTVYAVTTVLATFLGGLALGAVILGRVADRRARPLRLYGWLEIGIAFAALLGLLSLRLLDPLHIWAANRFTADSAALIGVRVLLGSLVILPATFLMGGTLPAITRFFVDRIQRVGREVSLLYALNSLGAVLGTLATGFLLIRWVGMHATLGLAVALNLAIGAISLALSRFTPGAVAPRPPADPPAAPHVAPGGTGLLLVMALSGFVSLGLEVIWTRVLMLGVGTTTYSFATMLASFLTGISLGGFLARRYIDRIADTRIWFGWTQIGIAASVVAALPLINSGHMQLWLSGWGADWVELTLLRFGVSLLVMLVPTTLIGMTFPLAAKLWTREVRDLGRDLGRLYGANTSGNILGAALTGFVLLPALGLQKGIALLTVLNLVCAAWAFWPGGGTERGRAGWRRAAPVLTGLVVCALLLLVWQPRPFPAWGEEDGDGTLYYREGVVGTVKVIRKARDPRRIWMAVDSIKIGESFGGVDQKQQALAHFPFLLTPANPPRSVLSIGLGTGILMGEVARHASVQRADCLEISPSVIEAARLFEPFNHGVLDDPALRVINDDGVNFLRRTDQRYDLIISDAKSRTTHAANATFFSLDYYRLCRDHLGAGGLMIQWVPLNVPPEELRTILRTFFDVFAYGYVWVAPPHSCFLVGVDRPLAPRPDRIDALLRSPQTANLRRYGITGADEFLSALVADGESLQGWLAGGALNSLEHPVLEFYSPRAYSVPPMLRAERNLVWLLRGRGPALATLEASGAAPQRALAGQRVLGQLAEVLRLLDENEPASTADGLRQLDRAAREISSSRVAQYAAAAAYRQALDADPDNSDALIGLARVLAWMGRRDHALERLRQALVLAERRGDATLAGTVRARIEAIERAP